jgi:hypothetical protein
MLQDSFMIQASDRLGTLFGVSILEDKGHARNELWYVVKPESRNIKPESRNMKIIWEY